MPSEYEIRLSRDVAVVLFEWLESREEDGWMNVRIDHRGELAALWQLGGVLERTIVESFDPQYHRVLEAARDRLAAQMPQESE